MSVTRDRINTFKRTGSQRCEIKIQKKFPGICMEHFESIADYVSNDACIFTDVSAWNRKLSSLSAYWTGTV